MFFEVKKDSLAASLHLHASLRNAGFIRMMLINVFMIERHERYVAKRN